VAEQRERLAELRALPRRQQQMLWMHAFGLSYREIAVETKCTERTVERQLLRAKRAVRAATAG
jgi:DNA-directed RNA polymerase specialized sigma24 family protein